LGGTNGNVAASVKYGNTLYVGGFFSHAGPITGSCVAVDAQTGESLRGFPVFNGPVRTVVADGRGGWFVGGAFTAVDGVAHGGLAHVDSRFRLVAWDPSPDGDVLALAVRVDTLLAAGKFAKVRGLARPYLAGFRIGGGELLDAPPAPNGVVRSLLVHKGRVFLGGDFDSVGGIPRGALAALNLNLYRPEDWNASLGLPGYYGSVHALAMLGDTLIAGGLWAGPDLSLRCLAAASTATGTFSGWSPVASGPDDDFFVQPHVDAIAVRDSFIFIGGHFTEVSGLARSGLAKIGFPSGALSAWNPVAEPHYTNLGEEVSALLMRGRALYVAGEFVAIGDSARSSLAAVDTETGLALPWNVGANFAASALEATGDTLIVGGEFQGAGAEWGRRRDALAAFDLTTGQLKKWSPRLDGLGVNCLAAGNGHIYVGGYFDMLGGKPRYCLGAVDTLTGDASDWDPQANAPVFAMRAVGDSLYVGGAFTSLAGQTRARIGRFDTSTGALTAWAPWASDVVRVFEPAGRRIFVGGEFVDFNGVRRPGLVAVDAVSGALEPFDCRLDFAGIIALAASGDTLYAGGGGFLSIGGQPRIGLAALDARTGNVLDWVADVRPFVTGLVRIDTVLYVGGGFTSIGGVPRTGMAALSAATGTVLPWNARMNGTVWSLTAYERTLFVGGGFTEALGSVRAYVLGMPLDSAPPPTQPPGSLSLSPTWPNPANGQVTLELGLPVADRVSLALYDLQGRLVVPVYSQKPVPAGYHRLTIPTSSLAAGFYACRMSVGGRTATRTFFVIR